MVILVLIIVIIINNNILIFIIIKTMTTVSIIFNLFDNHSDARLLWSSCSVPSWRVNC
jgi:hypothetical protein